MDPSLSMFLRALITSVLALVCVGQDSRLFPIDPPSKTLKANTTSLQPLFSCSFENITDPFNLAWTMNGLVMGNSTYVFNPEYRGKFRNIGSGNHGSILAMHLSVHHHLLQFTCRLYNSSIDAVLSDRSIKPVYETSVGVLRIPNKPSESDPACELGLTPGQSNDQLIEFRCCITLTREELTVSLIQKTVVYGRNVSDIVDDLSGNRRQCFRHAVSESALSDGNFQCSLESSLYKVKQTCEFHSFKPSINLSRLVQKGQKGADMTCIYDAKDIIGYTWSVDKEIEYTLSKDSKHFYIYGELSQTITVSCTVFTAHGFGSAKLQITIPPNNGPDQTNRQTVILISICMGAVICCLFFFIIFYLIYKRGICFCFRPPERYTQNDLRRMQLEREHNLAHFHKYRQPHPHGGGGETVSFVMSNGGNHRYQPPVDEDGDVPPIPGGNAPSSHLLDYADLDHGNTPSDIAEDPSIPQRPDNSKVEYADILKPPTKSLRDMS